MTMIGLYRLALLPDTDEAAFVKEMNEVVFQDPSALQSTRITAGFTHQLLKRQGGFREFAWHVTVDLVTDKGYDFDENIERIGKSVAGKALVVGLDVYTLADSGGG